MAWRLQRVWNIHRRDVHPAIVAGEFLKRSEGFSVFLATVGSVRTSCSWSIWIVSLLRMGWGLCVHGLRSGFSLCATALETGVY